MRHNSCAQLVGTLVWLLATTGSLTLFAAEFRHAEKKVAVKADEVVEDDIYAASEIIVIDGTLKGDLIAAGKDITINGTVDGNVFVIAQSVVVKGTVHGDLIAAGQGVAIEGRIENDARVAGQIVKVGKSATIEGDLVVAGMSLELEDGSKISADSIAAAMQALLAGDLGRNLYGSFLNCQLEGEVGGDVWMYSDGDGEAVPPQSFQQLPPGFTPPAVAGGLNIGEEARIDGKLTYQSRQEADIANPEAIKGGVKHIAIAPQAEVAQRQESPAEIALQRLKSLAAVAVIGLLTVLLVPQWSTEMAANLRHRFLLSVVAGLFGVFLFVALLVAVAVLTIVAMAIFGSFGLDQLTFASLGVGFFGTISLLGLLWFSISFLAPAVMCVFIGRSVGRSVTFPSLAAFLIGLVAVAILWAIPYAGVWIAWIIVVLGFGAFCVWLVAGAPPELVAAQAVAKR